MEVTVTQIKQAVTRPWRDRQEAVGPAAAAAVLLLFREMDREGSGKKTPMLPLTSCWEVWETVDSPRGPASSEVGVRIK